MENFPTNQPSAQPPSAQPSHNARNGARSNGGAPDAATTGVQTFAFSRFNNKLDNNPKPERRDWRGV